MAEGRALLASPCGGQVRLVELNVGVSGSETHHVDAQTTPFPLSWALIAPHSKSRNCAIYRLEQD